MLNFGNDRNLHSLQGTACRLGFEPRGLGLGLEP